MSMTVEIRNEVDEGTGEIVVVELIGSADLAGGEMLQRRLMRLAARHPRRVVFDLSRLTFIASMCMGSLTAFRRGCDKWGGTMALAATTEPVATALKRARLDTVFVMVPTLEAAMAHVSGGTPAV
jgi:anti-anti-sigma factor